MREINLFFLFKVELFIILIFSFLMRQPWMPRTVAIALIAVTAAITIITVASRLRANLRRNDRDYRKFDQSTSDQFNKVIVPESKEEEDSTGLGLFSCPKPANKKEDFTVMGGIQPAGSSNNFSKALEAEILNSFILSMITIRYLDVVLDKEKK